MSRIIDFHSHCLPLEIAQHTAFFKQHWSDVNKHLADMDHYHIDKAFLFYPATDAHLNMGGWKSVCAVYNTKMAELVSDHPDRFFAAGIVPVDDPSSILAEAQRVQDLGLRIFSLASSYEGRYLDDEIFYPLYDFAQRHRMPIHVHPQILSPIGEERVRDPLLTPVLEYLFDVSMCIGKMMMSGVFEQFPDVCFIFAHYGGVLPFVKERFDNTYMMLRSRNFVKDLGQLPSAYFKNLYFDTSGSRSLGSLLCALEVVDRQHILFGSDYPANQNISSSLAMIQDSPLSFDDKQDIFYRNALKILP